MKSYSKIKAAKSFKRFLYQNFANQNDMAEMFDVTPSAVNHWCTGKSRVPAYVVDVLSKMMPNQVPAHLFRPDLYKKN